MVTIVSVALLAIAAPASAFEFVDATAEAGIRFRHSGGGLHPWFPEMMGSGACWFDMDNDGYDDLFILNGRYRNENLQSLHRPHGQLYRNEGDGTFTDVTAGSGLAFEGYGNGCATGDFDADGCIDVYATGYDLSRLMRGACDGTFEDVTRAAGVLNDGCPGRPCWGHSSAWVDYDDDGDLDLYVGNYVAVGPDDDLVSPGPYDGQPNALYRNNGDGTFTDVAVAAGVAGDPGRGTAKTLAVGWQDFDLDGDEDVYVANDEVPQNFYRNRGDGTFEDVAGEFGVNWTRGGMGVAWGDFDRNGCPEVAVTFFAYEAEGLGRNDCDGTLRDESDSRFEHGLEKHVHLVRWANVFWDYDNDGWLDYIVGAGHVFYNQPGNGDQQTIVFRNDLSNPARESTFRNVSGEVGDVIEAKQNTRGVAFGDYNLDGLLDFLIVANNNQSARLVKGTDGGPNHWIELQLRQPGSKNLFAIGAVVTVTAGGVDLRRELVAGSGFESTNTYNLHFGLGEAATAERVVVRWPDNVTEEWTDLAANGLYRLTRGDPAPADDVVSPRTRVASDVPATSTGWYTSPVTITLEATDRGVQRTSGVTGTRYRIGDGAEATYDTPLSFSDEGQRLLRFRSTDGAENEEPLRAARVDLDFGDPATTHELDQAPLDNGWYPAGTRLTLTATDAVSGVAATYYRLSQEAEFRRYEGPFRIPGGDHLLEYYSVDAAGREEAHRFVDVDVDDLLPDTDAAFEGPAGDSGWWLGAVTVRLTAHDVGTGVRETRYSLNGDPFVVYREPFTVHGDGVHRLRYWSLDGSGNAEPYEESLVRIDTRAPASRETFLPEPGNDGWLRRLGVRMHGEDDGSGVAALRYRANGGEWVSIPGEGFAPDGRLLLELSARDVAGNEEPPRAHAFDVDGTPPVTRGKVEGPAGQNGWWRGNVTAHPVAQDATSGVVATWRGLDGAPLVPDDGPVPVLGEGVHVFRMRSEDAAGNVEDVAALPILIDWTPPETPWEAVGVEGANGWWVSPVHVRLVPRDGVSGVAAVFARLGDEALGETFTLTEGAHVVWYHAEDVAGNVEATREVPFPVDTTPPRTRLVVAGPSHVAGDVVHVTRDSHVALEASDATSGVAALRYRLDDGPALPYDAPLRFEGPDGPRVLEAWAVDLAGNVEPLRAWTVVLDTTGPAGRILSPGPTTVAVGSVVWGSSALDSPPVVVADRVRLAAAARDPGGAGVARVRFLVDGLLLADLPGEGPHALVWNVDAAASGARVLRVESEDALGNVGVVERSFVLVAAPTSNAGAPVDPASVEGPRLGVPVAVRSGRGGAG